MNELLKNELMQSQQEEWKDKEKYCRLAQMADENGCKCIAGVLRDIAKEEGTHAALIQWMLSR